MKVILCFFLLFFIVSCTDGFYTKKILEDQGYTEVEITGYSFFACSKDDWYHTGFRAKSPIGRPVSGTVCSGLVFKSHTIRLD